MSSTDKVPRIIRAPLVASNQIKIPRKEYESLGYCIYCGEKSTSLRLEHIVPFGLFGRHEFKGASCENCERETSRVETRCLQIDFGGFRARTRIPARKGRKRRYKLHMEKQEPDGVSMIDIPSSEFPRFLTLPIWSPPEILVNKPIVEDMWVYAVEKDFQKLSAKYGAGRIVIGVERLMFSRMIAKIAHSFTVAEMDKNVLNTFDLLLPDLILGKMTDHQLLVGGNHAIPEKNQHAYDIDVFGAVKGETEFIAARVRLLACLGTPLHIAVVGSRPLGTTTIVQDPVRL